MKQAEKMTRPSLNDNHIKIIEARHHDPFEVLGKHPDESGVNVCVYIPHAVEVSILEGNRRLERIGESDFFTWRGAANDVPEHYRLIWLDDAHRQHIAHDPYSYAPQIGDLDLHLLSAGNHRHAYNILGANCREVEMCIRDRCSLFACANL